MPREWSRGRTFTLVNIAGATFEGGLESQQIRFVDEDGVPISTLSAAIHSGYIVIRADNGTLLMLR
jgi:hypothetical protein